MVQGRACRPAVRANHGAAVPEHHLRASITRPWLPNNGNPHHFCHFQGTCLSSAPRRYRYRFGDRCGFMIRITYGALAYRFGPVQAYRQLHAALLLCCCAKTKSGRQTVCIIPQPRLAGLSLPESRSALSLADAAARDMRLLCYQLRSSWLPAAGRFQGYPS